MSILCNMAGVKKNSVPDDTVLLKLYAPSSFTVLLKYATSSGGSFSNILSPYTWQSNTPDITTYLYTVPISLVQISSSPYSNFKITLTIHGTTFDYKTFYLTRRSGSNYIYEISLIPYYLIDSGSVNSDLTLTHVRTSSVLSQGTDATYGDYWNLHSNAGGSTYDTAYFTPDIDVTNYKYLIYYGMAGGQYSATGAPAFGLINALKSGSNVTTFYAKTFLQTAKAALPETPSLFLLDVGSYTGTQKIGFQEGGVSGYAGDARVFEYYLI